MIQLINPFNGKTLERKENSYVDEDGNTFPIVNGVPRLVNDSNYTDSFGFQWNKFQKTQIDRETKNSSQSRERYSR